MTLGSLFDGSGGFPLAGILAGIEPIWAAEVEPFPIRVTTKRFPHMKHYGDVSKMNGGEIEPVDIITFGSPCQDLSVAGKRAGLGGERSGLFSEAIRIITEMREKTNGRYPNFIVWENVPGAFSSNKGEDFRRVIEKVCQIKEPTVSVPRPERWEKAGGVLGDGYSVAWRVLDAQYWGVPQRRERIFLVADFTGDRASKILFESEGVSGDTPQSGEQRQGITVAPEDRTGTAVSYQDRCGCAGGVKEYSNRSTEQERYQQSTISSSSGETICIEGNGSRKSHFGDGYRESDKMYTLNTVEQHAVAFGLDRASFNQGKNAQYDFSVEEELAQTLVVKGPGGVSHRLSTQGGTN